MQLRLDSSRRSCSVGSLRIPTIEAGSPMPLGGPFEPLAAAQLLAWLASEENGHMTGQTIFIDGGADVVLRGDSTW
jgi:NAD(P)-dependent dehydrogenase (short-subunit alcohol dehydrogenase family)